MADAKEVSAIGYSVAANIDGSRQITFQHFIASDATDEQVNADLDRIMRIVDRQRAVYEMPEIQEELDKLNEEISQYTEDKVTTAEANFLRAQADLDVQIATLQADHKKAFDTAYEQHGRSGRGGEFKVRGQTAAALDRIDAGIRQAIEQKDKNENERAQFVLAIDGNIQRRRDRIALLEGKLADLKAKIT